MAKRFTATEIWGEDWFLDMPNEYKLFWYYILSNCDHAGLFRVNLRSFCSLLGVNVTSSKALELFNTGKQRIRVISESSWLIEDFFVFQYGTTLNEANKVHHSVANLYRRQKIELTSIRGLLDLKEGVKDKDIDKDIKKGGVGENKRVRERGVSFDEDMEFVIFRSGKRQRLGPNQSGLVKDGRIQPEDVYDGLIN